VTLAVAATNNTCDDAVVGNTEVLYPLHDTLGSVIGLVRAGDGELVEKVSYDPYGQTYFERPEPDPNDPNLTIWTRTDSTGLNPWPTSAYGNPFLWTGQRHDAGVGLYHFMYCSYSPRLGRWMQRDPLRYIDGVNLYSYVGNIPLYFTDPYGLVSGTKNHIYPLYLGGHPDQPLRDHPEEKHHKIFHESLSKQGYPMGKRGRQKWRDASDAERRRALDQALQDSGDPRYQGENGKKNRDKDLNDATSDDYEPAPGDNNTDLRKNSKKHKSEQMRERRKRAKERDRLRPNGGSGSGGGGKGGRPRGEVARSGFITSSQACSYISLRQR
jgi:RHS repeat-associated protein